MHYVAKIEIEPFPPSGPSNFQNVVEPMVLRQLKRDRKIMS